MKVIPYLSFKGEAENAIHLYKNALSGEVVYIMRYKENEGIPCSEHYKEKLLHAQLQVGDDLLYLSDAMETEELTHGNQLEVNINFDSVEALEHAYAVLAEDALNIQMPLQDTFWKAKFASLTDCYGIGWSLNYTYPED
ncbi:MAG: glyoxalase/bleomycin resistance/extradiol dioxygenase family protein [Clostridia bacterium]|nr:glyoxalase/bleomycin resistance/extradiol dioxygenase family protein [Clostridia bacterium]